MRTCRDCGLTGAPELFAPNAASRYGRKNLCQECFRIRAREYGRVRRAKQGYEGVRSSNLQLRSRYARLQYFARVGSHHKKYPPVACTLTFDEYCALAGQPCHYCGTDQLTMTGSGLDRKDPFGPYSLHNVVPCCFSCNRRKKRRSYEEMIGAN